MKKIKVYISGAIAHHNIEQRKAAFDNAWSNLHEKGYMAFNPFLNGLDDSEPYEAHMRTDISMLLECDAIYMLKGWEKSNGAKLEFNVATSCGLMVMYENN